MVSPRLLISVALLSPFALFSQVRPSLEEHFSPLPALTDKAWENPAMIRYRYSLPLTSISGSFYNSSIERYGQFKAETFTHLKNVVIEAQANYDNGAKHNVRFCENADVSKVYPYLTYDAIGGNQNLERYFFGGSVSVKVNEKWSVGAMLSYDAGLYYRNVDPRPKNVTGDFRVGAGGSHSLKDNYIVGVSAHYTKYKQSCDIMFKSELGESKIYHLTGLGTHYNRFAGQGKGSYYTGNSYRVSLSLFPKIKGVYLEADFRNESINQILEDLNNLPMAKIKYTALGFQAGYKGLNWGIVASVDFARRHGYENIFGDAATGQYPQIGSIAMHLANSNNFILKGTVAFPSTKFTLYLNPSAGYNHYRELYREPYRVLDVDNLYARVECKAITTIVQKIMIRGAVSYQFIQPLSHSFENISINNPDLQPYLDVLNKGYCDATTRAHNLEASVGADLLICKGKYAVGIDVAYINNQLSGNHSLFSVSFKFK